MAVIERLQLKDFRNYDDADLVLGSGVTVIYGENGAGKTSLIEAIYFSLLGRSCRTSRDREVIKFGADVARCEVSVRDNESAHVFAIGIDRGSEKHLTFDGSSVERFVEIRQRPLIATFFPDRLALVKGAPGLRRSHLDQLVSALWPARVENRKKFQENLAQRNALLGRVSAGFAAPDELDVWDVEVAKAAVVLMDDRAAAIELLAAHFSEIAQLLGIDGGVEIVYKPRARVSDAEELLAELIERRSGDLERGFTGYGPHRDDIGFIRDGRELKTFGSQGEQRLGVLSLLLAERAALKEQRTELPVLLLDDVMSELDGRRRRNLIDLLAGQGQTVITTTEIEHVPTGMQDAVTRVEIVAGSVTEGVTS